MTSDPQGERITPNEGQRRLIETIQGPVLCDAGAGTGKTFTIAHRYLHILKEEDLTPHDVLLITFTNNAAEEMRERILRLGKEHLTPAQLRDAPISTFHALAKHLLEQHGFTAPHHLGLDTNLAPGFNVIEDPVHEEQLFQDFLRGFQEDHPQHEAYLACLIEPTNLLTLLHELAAKGILPTTEGWYRGSRTLLEGDRDAFLDAFDDANTIKKTKSPACKRFNRKARDKLFHPPTRTREAATKDGRIDDDAMRKAWDAPREELFTFVHDAYLGYLAYAIDRNVLNFQFLLLLAYVLLVEDDALRQREQFDHVMIDEFQDTSEIQLQIALLYSGEPNLCCVGDWKQSIYSFQYASIDNILRFDERVRRIADRLNQDRARVPPAPTLSPPETVRLTVNYRSTQPLLDTAPQALLCPATRRETLDEADIREKITLLESHQNPGPSRIQALACEDEIDNILAHIQTIVDNPDYALHHDEQARTPTYDDIAVLTRTRRFALNLQTRANHVGLPLAFEGGLEAFRTDEGKLLLAWFRLLEDHRSKRGWALLLEQAGYTLDEARHILDEHEYPSPMRSFLEDLRDQPTPGARARAIFDQHGLHNGITHALVEAIQTGYETSYKTPAQLVRFLEDHHDAKTVIDVDDHPGGNVVTVQTIHAAKGLEYPIVILADVNQRRFPNTRSSSTNRLRYDEKTGLRITKRLANTSEGTPFLHDAWDHALTNSVLDTSAYDEERRLCYVALSRAKQHLTITADRERKSRFFDALPIDPEPTDATPDPHTAPTGELPPQLDLEVPPTPVPESIPVGHLVPQPDLPPGGRGKRFGKRIHAYAANRALDQAGPPRNKHERSVHDMIGHLQDAGCDTRPEVDARLPLTLEGYPLVLEGKIDLLATTSRQVTLIDWKTAPSGTGLDAYTKQIRLYATIAQQAHPDKDIEAKIVYTENGRCHDVTPLPLDEVAATIREHLLDREGSLASSPKSENPNPPSPSSQDTEET